MADDKRAEEEGRGAELERELRALGRGMRLPDVDGETMAERVLAQLLADAAPVPSSTRTPTPTPALASEPERESDPGAGSGSESGLASASKSGPGSGRTLIPAQVPARLSARPVARVPDRTSGRAARAVRVRGLPRRGRRTWTAGLAGLLVALTLTPPVRAAVADWFDFGGVRVRYDPRATPGPNARAPGCADPVSMGEAEREAGFAPRVPTALGAPHRVSVDGAEGRPVISLCWTDSGGRTVRLEQFRAGLDLMFSKQIRQEVTWVALNTGESNGTPGLWFADPHLLRFRMIDRRGTHWTASARTAGPTLLWEYGGGSGDGESLTLRLEGVGSLDHAKAVAESMP